MMGAILPLERLIAMDHSCYKCGHSIDEGRAFCPHCGAPQIRVSMPEPAAAAMLSDSLPQVESGASVVHPAVPGFWRLNARMAAASAAISALLMFLGLNPFVAALVAGALAVALLRWRGLQDALPHRAGARLGALSGLFLFCISSLLESLIVLALHKGPEVRAEMLDRMQQVAGRYPGPEVQPFMDFVKSPGGFTFMMFASLVFGFIAFLVLGSLGGLFGAMLLGRKSRP
jgi:MFS family permease